MMAEIRVSPVVLTAAILMTVFITVLDSHEISGCYGDSVTIACGMGEKIKILGDFYGLAPPDAESKVCAYSERDICVVPSQSQSSAVKKVCNGRTTCIFTVSEKHMCINGIQETTYQQIKYECIKESDMHSMCGEASWASSRGYLTSPNYPISYPPQVTCTCRLATSDDSFVLLKTSEFRLRRTAPCRDYLLVEPESNPEEILCGSVHRIFEARKFTLHFHSVLSSFKGFLLSYEATSDVSIQCSPRLHATTTKATTPTVTTPTRTSPTATTQAEAKEATTGIVPKKPGTIDSLPQQVWPIQYENETDIIYPEVGTHEEATPAPPSQPPRRETTPYPEDLEPSIQPAISPLTHMVSGCFGDIVHFQCKDGELIRIVEDLYGSAPDGRCTYQEDDCVVEAVGQRSIVSQICSSKTRCMNFIVTRMFCGEQVTSYQQITYECVPATAMQNMCTRAVLQTRQGYLASPNFPGMYPRNQTCSCTLRTTDSLLPVRVAIAHFALHGDLRKSCEDWLEVDLGRDGPADRLCGSQHGHFEARSLTLRFRSDSRYSHSGFWLHFKGENNTEVTIACNVPIDSVWPTTTTVTTTTATTTTTTSTTTTTTAELTTSQKTTIRTEWTQQSAQVEAEVINFPHRSTSVEAGVSPHQSDASDGPLEDDGVPLGETRLANIPPEDKRAHLLGSFQAEEVDGDNTVSAPGGGSENESSAVTPVAPPPAVPETPRGSPSPNQTALPSVASVTAAVKLHVLLWVTVAGRWL